MEINEQIRDIRMKEQEANAELGEREAEMAEILLRMRAANTQAEDNGGMAHTQDVSGLQTTAGAVEEGIIEDDLQRSCIWQFDDMDEPIIRDENSIASSYASNGSANIQRSRESITLPQTPTQHSSPSVQSSNKSNSRKPTSRRSTLFLI
jgi:hypothetical protein